MGRYDENHVEAEEYDQHTMAPQHMSIGRYLGTRFSTLKPPMHGVPNPIRLLRMLNTQQWLFFLVGFIGWTWDAFDFFVSPCIPRVRFEVDV